MSISRPEKLKMETADMTAANIERIAGLFPNVITEIEDEDGNVRRGIDFDLLRQELSGDYVEGREERYDFTWVGKRQAIIESNRPIQKTLRPCIEESKDWESTENVYIEGDNLDALKLLQESYLNRIKMIYIDPPYNTGKDFVYKDNFTMDRDEYDEEIGIVDDEGNYRFRKRNTKDEGRYHSKWCSMLYPRLKLARNLLREDGVIFVSIDDNEVHNLRKVMDEIFGEENFLGSIVWKKKTNGNNMGYLPPVHDYFICYAKEASDESLYGFPLDREYINRTYSNPDNDPRGPWTTSDLSANHRGPYFKIANPSTGEEFYPPEGRYWVFGPEEVKKRISDGRIIFGKTGNGRPVQKKFLSERESMRKKAESWWDNHGMNEDGMSELGSILSPKIFDHPKPSITIKHICNISSHKYDIILDFFAGSSTTAHAVMQLNAEDGGNRKFIMVQLPEACDENTEAYKAGFKNISEIGKERIRRAGEQIKKEIENKNRQSKLNGEPSVVPDIGFRVFKIGDTNMKDVYYSAAEYSQETIEGLVDNVKEDRTDLDLLYQVLINWGLPLDLKHEMEEIDGFTIHIVDTDALIACFEPNIPESVMRKIAERKPLRAVFRDGSFRDSPSKLNIEGIFKTIAPDTTLRVI